MALPNFLVIGSPKAGSTAVHAALVRHPQLFLSTPKETKHFMTDGAPPPRAGQRGPGDAHSAQEWMWRREEYERLFDAAPPGRLRGESTPFYLWDRTSHRRIRAAVPDAKLIAVIRDPIDRAYSNWIHLRADGLEPERDFMAAVELEPWRVRHGYAPFWRYLELGRYGEQLEHLFDVFPREQVFVVRYRELIDSPAATLDEIFRFLGVEPGIVTAIPASNTSAWAAPSPINTGLSRVIRGGATLGSFVPPKVWRQAQRPLLNALHRHGPHRPELSRDDRRELVARVAPDVAVLERVMGRSYQDWLSDTGGGAYTVRSSLAPSGREASQ